MTDYIYSILTNFPNQIISCTCLDKEINGSSIVSVLSGIVVVGDVVTVTFVTALTAPEKLTLDGLVVAHNHNCPAQILQQAQEQATSTALKIQKTDIDKVLATEVINFEGSLIDVIDEGNGKSTVTISGGGFGGAKFEQCFYMSHLNDNFGEFATTVLGSNFNFIIPDNFTSIVTLEVIMIPTINPIIVGDDVDLDSNYGKIGENFATHAETINNLAITGVLDQIMLFDISSVFSLVDAGDHCGLKIGINTQSTVHVLCIRLRYN